MHVLLRFGWWVYMIILVSMFLIALVLNYIVKKINEARLDERLNRLREKASSTRSSQVQRQQIEIASAFVDAPEQSNSPNMKSNPAFPKQNSDKPNNGHQIQISNIPDSKQVSTVVADPANSGQVDVNSNASNQDIVQPVFLGVIYKDLTAKSIDRSKSLSNADCIIEEVFNKMVMKIKESQSTPSVKRMITIQNPEDILLGLAKTNDSNHEVIPTSSM